MYPEGAPALWLGKHFPAQQNLLGRVCLLSLSRFKMKHAQLLEWKGLTGCLLFRSVLGCISHMVLGNTHQ